MKRCTQVTSPDTTQAAIVDAILKSGLSHTEIAQRMGVTDGRVSQIYHAHKGGNFTLNLLEKLAKALGYRLSVRFVPDEGLRKD